MKFSIEDIYGVTRHQYCFATDITPQDLITHLEAEIMALRANYDTVSDEYRNGGRVASNPQRIRATLLGVIDRKIQSKSAKVKDIKREFGIA
jgi:hypothetical protein